MTSSSDALQAYLSGLPELSEACSSRAHALYSDLSRLRQSNPAAYAANAEWWTQHLETIVLKGIQDCRGPRQAGKQPDRFVLHFDQALPSRLLRNGIGVPLGLATVVTDASQSRRFLRLSEFLSSPGPFNRRPPASHLPSIYSVASTLIGRPLWWALQQMSLVGDGETYEDPSQTLARARGDYVLVENMESVVSRFLDNSFSSSTLSPAESVYSTTAFAQHFAKYGFADKSSEHEAALSQLDLKVVLRYLTRDKRVAVVDKGVVKLQMSADGERPLSITSADRGIVEIKDTLKRLEQQIQEVEKEIERRSVKISESLRAKRKAQALSYLRSRKMLEDVLVKRVGSQETLQGVLLKIEQAAGDIEVMQAYETATKTLRGLLAHPNLNMEHVSETMEAMSDAIADHAEIEQAIQAGSKEAREAAGVEMDETELEEELEELVRASEKKEKYEEEGPEGTKEVGAAVAASREAGPEALKTMVTDDKVKRHPEADYDAVSSKGQQTDKPVRREREPVAEPA